MACSTQVGLNDVLTHSIDKHRKRRSLNKITFLTPESGSDRSKKGKNVYVQAHSTFLRSKILGMWINNYNVAKKILQSFTNRFGCKYVG